MDPTYPTHRRPIGRGWAGLVGFGPALASLRAPSPLQDMFQHVPKHGITVDAGTFSKEDSPHLIKMALVGGSLPRFSVYDPWLESIH